MLSLAILSAAAVWIVQRNGWTLYYGDAEAHLQVARRMVDSRTPGYGQLGAVWLPLPHLLMLPLVWNDVMWRTGLAGAIPSAIFFVAGGGFLFAAARRAFHSVEAGVIATGVFALNPNILYLQATPMTEPIFFASIAALLYFTVVFAQTATMTAAAGAGVASFIGTLTRYDAWFLIPFVAAYIYWRTPKRRLKFALVYGAIACLGPLLWIAHNVWWFSDPFDFYRGPYSPKAIQKGVTYPGDHDWPTAIEYVFTAGRLCAGWVTLTLGIAGIAVAIRKLVLWPLLLLSLTPCFYVWSMASSSATPIFVPNLPPHGYYNTRYGLCFVVVFAFASGSLALLAPARRRSAIAAAAVAITALFWLIPPSPGRWITWKESQVNSQARRAWTKAAADYLAGNYRNGGIFTMLGDEAGIYREAGIPLRQALTDGNEPAWMAAAARPDLFLYEKWAVAQGGDEVSKAVAKMGNTYTRVDEIVEPGAPPLDIYRRNP